MFRISGSRVQVRRLGRSNYLGCLSQAPFRTRGFSTSSKEDDKDIWSSRNVQAAVSHNFPDFIEHWNRDLFRKVGYGLGTVSAAAAAGAAFYSPLLFPAVATGTVTAAYWYVGMRDMKQTSHAIRRNYPVLGNLRYIFETVCHLAL